MNAGSNAAVIRLMWWFAKRKEGAGLALASEQSAACYAFHAIGKTVEKQLQIVFFQADGLGGP